MIRVLHICAALNDGGVERFIFNYYGAINREQIQFDFIVHSSKEGILEAEVQKLGGSVYHVPPKSKNAWIYYRRMRKILQEGHYDIVHCHQGYKSAYPLVIAMRSRIPVRIAHAHTSGEKLKWYQNIIRGVETKKTCKYATVLFACSDTAGKYMWGDQSFTIVPNAVDLEKFRFSEKSRKEIRRTLNIEQNWVIGCVGRMVPSKNHKRLLKIVGLLQELCPQVALLLIGSGPLEEELKELAMTQKLKNVMFLGSIQNVEAYLSACDEFVLPTLYEGFGMALLEAQESGLETITSNIVPEAVVISNRLHRVSLEDTDELWVHKIMEEMNKPREGVLFTKQSDQYDIYIQADILAKRYKELIEDK